MKIGKKIKNLKLRNKRLKEDNERLKQHLYELVTNPLSEKSIAISLGVKTQLQIEHSIWQGSTRNINHA